MLVWESVICFPCDKYTPCNRHVLSISFEFLNLLLCFGFGNVFCAYGPYWVFTLAVLFFTQSAPSSWLEMNNFIGDLMAFSASGSGQLLKCTNNQSLRTAWESMGPETPAPKSCYPNQSDPQSQSQRKNMAGISSHSGERVVESANCDEQQCECIATDLVMFRSKSVF